MTEEEGSGFYSFNIGDTVFPKKIQADNFVKTTRYTLLSFIPLTIFENFQRVANIYFLVIAILSCFPWSPVSPVIQIFPLVFVVVVSMVKAGIEDLIRYSNDKKVNGVKFEVYRDGKFKSIPSKEIRPGDIYMIKSGVEMPTDILILSSSENGGECYANEVNLNGETAIKQRKALFASSELSPEETTQISGTITIPNPCKDIAKLDGTIEVNDTKFPFSIRNCILRGVFIRQTGWIVGVALYTGHNTRIIENQRHPPHKTSHLERRLNQLIGIDFGLNFFLIFLFSALDLVKENTFDFAFIIKEKPTAYTFFQSATAYAILLSYMVPIAMYVTIEFIRLFQRWTFSTDLGMYEPGLGFCKPNNSNLNEELGQIDHVFSDKTGTLTENRMKFVQMSSRGTIYDCINNINGIIKLIGENEDVTKFLRCLALCHSVIVSSEGYSSESPDEEALVEKTKELGIKLISRQSEESITIEVKGEEEVVPQLAIVGFTSARKRMSIVVRENDKIVMYTKGADAMVMSMIKKDEDQDIFKLTQEHVDAFAEQGLRTLVLGYRELDENEFREWKARLDEAAVQLENRDENIARVGAEIEHDLSLLGAVAIEDELQPFVPETVAFLARMDVRFWVLTGDKKETAVSIAKATNVIIPNSPVFELLEGSEEERESVRNQVNQSRGAVTVISPDGLQRLIDEDPKLLVDIGDLCRSVVCFRMSPYLKSKVIEVVREHTKRVTLAIGDGANDVNMIQTAHVGVGIFGREGHQAAANSDFAITRFKHLKRLMTCHGRLSLLRLSGVILYMMFKNLILIFPQMIFNCYTLFSPVTIYDSFLLSTYNLVWTIFPPVEYGWFEQDLSFRSMMTYPYLYKEARAGRYLSWWRILLEFINSVFVSFIVFYFNVYYAGATIIDSFGSPAGFQTVGFLLFISIVMVANIEAVVRKHSWNIYLFLSVYISIFVCFLFTLPYGSLPTISPTIFYVPQNLFSTPSFYVFVLITCITCIAPEALFRYLKAMWRPSFSRIVRESEQMALDGQRAPKVFRG